MLYSFFYNGEIRILYIIHFSHEGAHTFSIWNTLGDLLPLLQIKKHEKQQCKNTRETHKKT